MGQALGNLGGQREEVAGEIQATEDGADDRHDDVLDHRVNDLAEGTTDDHTDGEVDDVALQGKVSEFSQHGHVLFSPGERGRVSVERGGNGRDAPGARPRAGTPHRRIPSWVSPGIQ